MTPRTVLIVCRRMPSRLPNVPAVRERAYDGCFTGVWRCSWCGQRVKVVA